MQQKNLSGSQPERLSINSVAQLLIINKYEKYEILAAINIRQIIAITTPATLQAPYFLKFIHKVISAPTQSAA